MTKPIDFHSINLLQYSPCLKGPSSDPEFIVPPSNIVVQSINGVMRGAFSCSVSPGADVQSITWFFESAIVNQDPTPVNISDPNVLVESAGGTSVLVLDNVGMGQDGFYHCEAQLKGGTTLNSTTATLEFSGECAFTCLLQLWSKDMSKSMDQHNLLQYNYVV